MPKALCIHHTPWGVSWNALLQNTFVRLCSKNSLCLTHTYNASSKTYCTCMLVVGCTHECANVRRFMCVCVCVCVCVCTVAAVSSIVLQCDAVCRLLHTRMGV